MKKIYLLPLLLAACSGDEPRKTSKDVPECSSLDAKAIVQLKSEFSTEDKDCKETKVESKSLRFFSRLANKDSIRKDTNVPERAVLVAGEDSKVYWVWSCELIITVVGYHTISEDGKYIFTFDNVRADPHAYQHRHTSTICAEDAKKKK